MMYWFLSNSCYNHYCYACFCLLRERVDKELREKEKIRSDLEKAEKLKSQLAAEVDEHHSAIEHTNTLKIR